MFEEMQQAPLAQPSNLGDERMLCTETRHSNSSDLLCIEFKDADAAFSLAAAGEKKSVSL